jgi:hypothetical protein
VWPPFGLHRGSDASDLLTLPADAEVARLVGYDRVIDVEIDERGRVLRAG